VGAEVRGHEVEICVTGAVAAIAGAAGTVTVRAIATLVAVVFCGRELAAGAATTDAATARAVSALPVEVVATTRLEQADSKMARINIRYRTLVFIVFLYFLRLVTCTSALASVMFCMAYSSASRLTWEAGTVRRGCAESA
jgi:hypothetical protein